MRFIEVPIIYVKYVIRFNDVYFIWKHYNKQQTNKQKGKYIYKRDLSTIQKEQTKKIKELEEYHILIL